MHKKINKEILFDDFFDKVHSQKDLDELVSKFPDYDPYYIYSASIPERRIKFEKLFEVYKPYANKQFHNQKKIDFHPRTWEMYCGASFVKKNILPKTCKKDEGPDFKIDKNIWFECVISNDGVGQNEVPKPLFGKVNSIPEEQIILRFLNSFNKKYQKYQRYLQNETINPEDPFVIAINYGIFGISYPLDIDIPIAIKALYNIQCRTLSVPVGNSNKRIEGFKKRSATGEMFLDQKYNGISAVIACSNDVLNHAEETGSDLYIVVNPNAKNPLPKKFIGLFKQYHEFGL
jgi:hypothetical protein